PQSLLHPGDPGTQRSAATARGSSFHSRPRKGVPTFKAHRENARGSWGQYHTKASPTSFPASTGWLHSR
ncbi:unnamed protein product, partial [Rangifer tarandus platyrhynchus]